MQVRVHPEHEPVEGFDGVLRRAFGGKLRDPDLDRASLVADVAPLGQHLRGRRQRRWQRIGDERAASAPAQRVHVTALPERDQRLTQR